MKFWKIKLLKTAMHLIMSHFNFNYIIIYQQLTNDLPEHLFHKLKLAIKCVDRINTR